MLLQDYCLAIYNFNIEGILRNVPKSLQRKLIFYAGSIQNQNHFFLFYTFGHYHDKKQFLLYNAFQDIFLFLHNLLGHFLIFYFRVFLKCLYLNYMDFHLCVFLLVHMFHLLNYLAFVFQMLLNNILHLGHLLYIRASVESVRLLGLVFLDRVSLLVVVFFLFYSHIFYIFFHLVLNNMSHLFFLLPILLRSSTHLHSGSTSFRHFAIL